MGCGRLREPRAGSSGAGCAMTVVVGRVGRLPMAYQPESGMTLESWGGLAGAGPEVWAGTTLPGAYARGSR